MNVRERLPDRRPAETLAFKFAGLHYTVTAGFYPDGSLGEIFIRNHKTGNASDTAVRDAGILLSLLLQHGCAAETISHAVSRNSDGSVGAVVDRPDSCEITMSPTGAGSTFAAVFRARALRALLKTAKCRFDLCCLEAREEALVVILLRLTAEIARSA